MTITIVLKREDMYDSKKHTPKDEIDIFSCFDISRFLVERAHTIDFIDDDGQRLILKNREQ